MTDYQPLIARAVDTLDKSTGEARRALYERARTALVTQLRSVEPSLSESEITKERLALEEAIRRVEADAARKSRTEPRAPTRSESRERRPAAPPRTAPAPAAVALEKNFAQPAATAPAPEAPSAPPPPPPPAPVSAREKLLGSRTRSLMRDGIKGFRDVVNDVQGLGGATAKAAQSARDIRDSYAAPPTPYMPRAEESEDAHASFERDVEADEAGAIDFDAHHLRSLEPTYDLDTEQPPTPLSTRPQPPRMAAHDEEFVEPRPPRSYRGLVMPIVALLILLGVGATISWQWSNIAEIYQYFARPAAKQPTQTTQQQPAPAETPATPKFPGRVPQQQAGGQAGPGSQTAPAVAQRVVLYEEDPNDPQGKRFVGSAIWRTETVSPGPGLAPELAVRADIEIPDRRMTVTWSLRRNTDKALPASHTIEIMFNLPADFPGGGIGNVPGILMKEAEQARGTPLAGLAVKVTNGFFLIGLSAADADMQRNLQLLKDRQWFDIPVVYTNGGRAILAMEKGPPGDRAFAEAFAAWDKK
jgi:hypothetical protein